MLGMMPAWQPVGPRVLGATAAACRHATPRNRGRKEEPTRPESRPSATIQKEFPCGRRFAVPTAHGTRAEHQRLPAGPGAISAG